MKLSKKTILILLSSCLFVFLIPQKLKQGIDFKSRKLKMG